MNYRIENVEYLKKTLPDIPSKFLTYEPDPILSFVTNIVKLFEHSDRLELYEIISFEN